LELTAPYDPLIFLGGNSQMNYSFHRGLIESISYGSHYYLTEGMITKGIFQVQPGAPQQITMNDERKFDGWRLRK
jgi:hypothetical protein